MDDMCPRSTALKPDIKAAEGSCFIHFAENSSICISGVGFYPATVAKRLIPFWWLDAFHVHIPISFHPKGTAKFAIYGTTAAFPFNFILFIYQVCGLSFFELIQG